MLSVQRRVALFAALPLSVHKAMTSPDVDAILRGDPTEAIEAAKRIIVNDSATADALAGIAGDKDRNMWSRIAAIYALGFIDDTSTSGAVLVGILADRNETDECRSHAAEALAHVKHPQAVSTMEAILHRMNHPMSSTGAHTHLQKSAAGKREPSCKTSKRQILGVVPRRSHRRRDGGSIEPRIQACRPRHLVGRTIITHHC